MYNQEVDPKIVAGPFQLRIFYVSTKNWHVLMAGIDPNVITHKGKVDFSRKYFFSDEKQ